jgi:tetratricopeptide (TPR) repeat protein
LWLIGGFIVGLLLLQVPLQEGIHKQRPRLFDPARRTQRAGAFTVGPTAAVIASLGGFRTVAADLLWLRAERAWHGDWWAMVPLMETITELDPHFLMAWKVYGWHCAYNLHGESVTLIEKRYWLDRGLEVLERAVEANPDTWDMYFDLGWTYYDRAHEPYRAAEAFRQAAEFPDAPHYVTRMYYRAFEHIMDFDRLFPALEYARQRHPDDANHQRLVKRDTDWWKAHWQDPAEHRRQIVMENTARGQRAIDYYLYPDDPFWDVCPACGLPSPKGSGSCEVCGQPFAGREPAGPEGGRA